MSVVSASPATCSTSDSPPVLKFVLACRKLRLAISFATFDARFGDRCATTGVVDAVGGFGVCVGDDGHPRTLQCC